MTHERKKCGDGKGGGFFMGKSRSRPHGLCKLLTLALGYLKWTKFRVNIPSERRETWGHGPARMYVHVTNQYIYFGISFTSAIISGESAMAVVLLVGSHYLGTKTMTVLTIDRNEARGAVCKPTKSFQAWNREE